MAEAVDMNSDSFDSVDFLLNNSIECLTFDQKVDLKSKIARPKLNISQKDGKYNRTFQESWYKKYRWLTGSKTKQTYHCYYCLMFGGEVSWSKVGQKALKNFELKASKHAYSKMHIKNSETFHMLGRCRIDYRLSQSARVQAEKHNESVARNRKIVCRLVDVVCHLGKQEQAFRVREESDAGNYVETLKLLAMEEGLIKDHLETSTVFKGTSSDIQNDLIDSVTIAINEKIHSEIHYASFVSIQTDETTDVSAKAQLSIIARYVLGKNIEERFMGFYDVSSDKSTEGLSKRIIAVLEKYNIGEKLVCHTHDGASVMAGSEGGVQAIIRRKYPQAIFVHCYAHHLNLVLLHGAKTIKDVKFFICNLAAFHSFFNRSTSRAELLRQLGFQLPHPVQTRWNYNSRAVSTIKHHYLELRRAASHVTESDDWDPESINSAIGLLTILDSFVFTFLLCLFSRIFVFSEHLLNVYEAKCTSDVSLCINEIRTVKSNISSLRSENVLQECLQESLKLNTNHDEDFRPQRFVATHKRVAFEILDSVIMQLDKRFGNFEEVSFVELLNHKKFDKFKISFPETQFQKLKSTYSNVFNFVSLRNELINIYYSEDKAISCIELLGFIVDNELEIVYEQTVKLLQLILTIPICSATSERSMSTLKRIKTYLRNSITNNGPSNIATISIEKKLSQKCSQDAAFKERVTDIFSEMKQRRSELIYKKKETAFMMTTHQAWKPGEMYSIIIEPDTVQEINDETKRFGNVDTNFDPKKELHKRKAEEHLEFSLPKRPRVQSKKQEDPKNLDPAEKKKRRDDCRIFGEHVANKLSTYDSRIRATVQQQINHILLEADTGRYSHCSPAPPGRQETSSDLPQSSSSQPYLEVVKEEEGITEQHVYLILTESLEEEMMAEV